MWNLFVSVLSLFSSLLVLFCCVGMLNTLVGLRADTLGFSATNVGLMLSAFYVGFIISTIKSGDLINRVGHIRAFAVFCGGASATVLALSLFESPWIWLLLRLVMGYNVAGLYLVAESWLNARATAETRGTLLALYMIISFMGLGGGNMLLSIGLPPEEFFILTAMGFSLALIPVAITRATHPQPVSTSVLNFMDLYRISPVAVVGSVTSGLLFGAVLSMGPLYGRALSWNNGEVGVLMTGVIASGVLLQYPIGRLSDRLDRRSVILMITGATALLSALLALTTAQMAPTPFSSPSGVAILLGLILYGSVTALLYPLCLAYANDYVDPSHAVQTSGGLLLAYSIGAAIGGTSASWAMAALGTHGLFSYSSAIALAFALFGLYRSRQRSWSKVMEKEAFVPVPEGISTPVLAELDPRSEGTQLALDLTPDEAVARGSYSHHRRHEEGEFSSRNVASGG